MRGLRSRAFIKDATRAIGCIVVAYGCLAVIVCLMLAGLRSVWPERDYPGDHRAHLRVGGDPQCVAFSPDGRILAVGTYNKIGGMVQLWDVASESELVTLRGINGYPHTITFSPDGRFLVAGGYGLTPGLLRKAPGEIQVWEVGSWREIVTLRGHLEPVHAVAFSPDNRTLASAGGHNKSGDVRLWDVESWKQQAVLNELVGCPESIAFSPNGRILAVGSGIKHYSRHDDVGEITLWDPSTATLTGRLAGHSSSVTSLAFSPNGSTLASCDDWTRECFFWDPVSQQRTGKLLGCSLSPVAFDPTGAVVITAQFEDLRLWDVDTHKAKGTLKGERQHDDFDSIRAIAVSPDGRTVATVSLYGVKLWTLPSPVPESPERASFSAHAQ